MLERLDAKNGGWHINLSPFCDFLTFALKKSDCVHCVVKSCDIGNTSDLLFMDLVSKVKEGCK